MQCLNDILDLEERRVLEVAPTSPISDVAGQLAEHNIGAVVVLDAERRLVGIASERDVVRAAANSDPTAMAAPVSTVMSQDVQTCTPSDDIQSLLAQMDEHRIRHLPVITDDAVVGIISIRDLMSAVLIDMRRQNEDLRDMSDLLADMYAEAAPEGEATPDAEQLEEIA